MHKKQNVEKDTVVFFLFFLCTNFVNYSVGFYVIIGKLEKYYMTFSLLSEISRCIDEDFVSYINT